METSPWLEEDTILQNLNQSKRCFELSRQKCLRDSDITNRYDSYLICKLMFWNNQGISKPPMAVQREMKYFS